MKNESVFFRQEQILSSEEALEKTLDLAGVKPGAIIGEVGAGEGFFTATLIKRLGESGKIYANDIDRESLEILKKTGYRNVEVVLGESDDPKFPVNNLDLVIMRSVFHDLENPLSMMENIKKYLKPDAPLVIIDSYVEAPYELTSLPMHNLTKNEFLAVIDQSSYESIHSIFLPMSRIAGYSILKVNEEKKQTVWSNWLANFREDVKKIQQFEKKEGVSSGKKRIAWERLLNSYRDDNPETAEDERLRKDILKRIDALDKNTEQAPLPQSDLEKDVVADLRSDYISIGMDEIADIYKQLGFEVRAKIRAISGDFQNEFETLSSEGDQVIFDKSTGLYWHPGGSEKYIDYFTALEWIDDLNVKKYGGFSDWRMPTVEEATSIMETEKKKGELYIDPLFSEDQGVIWSGDGYYPGRLWIIRFYRASIADDQKNHVAWVRPVRSSR
jgi:ubiquinone/menaquinone biosynthesis C-methylase UbiE